MGIIVQKYGGSSVADVPRLRAIAAALVARHQLGDRLVVVVSAMGKTTDRLIGQAREISADPPRRELDMLVTAGERISMALLSMAIAAEGGQAISFTGSQSGIITDEQHQGARILEVRPQRILEQLHENRIVIVAGYQGISRQREITTLGRGGSDTTAVALAAALGADACEIYSDVDGVYSADPNVCAQARLLPQIPYAIMHSMAGAGARVLSADAVEFARRAGVVILARKTLDSSGRQTQVQQMAPPMAGAQAVVGAKHVSLLRAAATERISEAFWAMLRRLGGRLFAMGPQMWLVDRTGIPGKDQALIQRLAAPENLVCDEVGAVTLVGSDLLDEAMSRVPAALAGIPTHGYFGTDVALTAVVACADVDEAVRGLHRHVVVTSSPP